MRDNKEGYGFIPLSPLRLYTGDLTYYQNIPDIIRLHRIVSQSGKPNYLGCRIPVISQLNITAWRKHLNTSWDQQIVDLLEFGFPLDFDRNIQLQSTELNHKSAIQFKDQVEKYIQEELSFKAICGPFENKPINCHISPMMTREKQDSDNRRTIIDLSWPHNASVNSGVSKFSYLNTCFTLTYPSIDTIVERIKQLGPAAKICKVDISRAFRQLRVEPRDIDLLGLKSDSYYLDLSVAFGFRSGSGFFQRSSDAIRYIMAKNGYPGLINYIDDLIRSDLLSKINNGYQFLLMLLQELGLPISSSKLVPPTTSAVCLGIRIDTVSRTISIPIEKCN